MTIAQALLKSTVAIVLCITAKAAYANLDIVNGAPSGFENLEAPRATFVIVTFGGKQLGGFSAHITPDSITFDNMDLIARALPILKDKDSVIQALTGKLETHAEVLCRPGQTRECGVIKPAKAAIVFNEAKLSMELFINPAYLQNQNNTGPIYLPVPERRFSSLQNISGAFAGTNSDTPNFTLTNNAVTAFGEGRIESQFSATNSGINADTAVLRVDKNGFEESIGIFNSQYMQLIPDRNIAGVSIATSMNTRYDQHKIQGNSVILFLTRRAIVSIYRDGRLYATRPYEAGNQYIDTSELPEGAYNITLKIQDFDGTTHEETRFFAKWPDIPPPDIPSYYAQAGIIRNPVSINATLPEFSEQSLIRLGTVRRIRDNMGFEASLLGLDDRVAMENSVFLLEPGIQLRSTLLSSTHGDYGFQCSYQQIEHSWNMNIDARRLFTADKVIPSLSNSPLFYSYTQVTAGINYNVTPDMTVGLRGNYSVSAGSDSARSYGTNIQYFFWRNNENMLSLNAETGENNNNFEANLFLHLIVRFGKNGLTNDAGFTKGNTSNGIAENMRVFHDDTTPDHSLIVGASLQKDADTKSVNLDSDWRNQFGRVQGFVQEADTSGTDRLNYNGNFNFGIAQEAGEIHIGGDQIGQSAVIVTLKGDSTIPMKILVNGSEHGTVSTGGTQAVYLSPYQVYTIGVLPTKGDLVDFDGSIRTVTLYPGTVTPLEWEVNKVYVVLAHIFTEQGTPLVNASLKESKEPVSTDEKGLLQAMLSHAQSLTFITSENNLCTVELPANVTPLHNVLVYPEVLVCHMQQQDASAASAYAYIPYFYKPYTKH